MTKKILSVFPVESVNGAIVTFGDGADNIPVKNLKITLSPSQTGSGDPSPDNVRSISGYDTVTVTRTGKNIVENLLVDGTTAGVTYTKNADGSITAVGTFTSSSAARDIKHEFTLPLGTYILTGGSENVRVGVNRYNKSGTLINRIVNTGGESTVVVDDTVGSLWYGVRGVSGETVDITIYPMIRLASIADGTYEPYQGETYTITIPTSAGTVYGGQLTVDQDGSGTLVVDRLKINASSLTWSQSAQVACRFVAYVNPRSAGSRSPVVCSVLPSLEAFPSATATGIFMNTTTQIIANFPDITTLEDWNAMIAAKQPEIVYQPENATTYTLTAEAVTTLLGDNTLWMDADGTIDLEYRADTQMYIDNRISALNANLAYIEDGMTASRAYSVGQFVLIGGQLYKVTASIASGATFTIGTNVVSTTVGTELTALQ